MPEIGDVVGSNQARERPREDLDGSIVSSASNITPPSTRRNGERNNESPNAHGIQRGRGSFSTASTKDLEEKALSK